MTLHNPLHDLDQIHASEKTKEETLSFVLKHKRSPNYKMTLSVVGTCFCLLFIFFIQPWKIFDTSRSPQLETTFISIDINPSMEWELDKDQQIISINTFNEDAKLIIKELDILHKPLEESLHLLFANEKYQDYLANGILEVGVYSDNQEQASLLEKEILVILNTTFDEGKYHCNNITKETRQKSNQHHMSSGKYRVIEQILIHDKTHTTQELKVMSMNELYAILSSYDETIPVAPCESEDHTTKGNGKHRHKKGF